MSRRDTILSMLDVSGHGLEIGPSYNPLFRKDEGYQIESLDYASQEDLKKKYRNTPNVDPSVIEPVDYVSDGRPMSEVIGPGKTYDYIVASHVIEHTPDFISFLNDCGKLLKPAGTVFLAIPDKRCCFDLFQCLTSTGEILDAHDQQRTRPSAGSLFNDVAYGATQNDTIGWSLRTWGKRKIFQPLENAFRISDQHRSDTVYRDVHVWRFVPSSFELIMNDLSEGGKISLRIENMICTDEMLVTLSRQGQENRRNRLQLMEAILDELAVPSKKFGELASQIEQVARNDQSTQHQEIITSLQSELAKEKEDAADLRVQLQHLLASNPPKATGVLRSVIEAIRSVTGGA